MRNLIRVDPYLGGIYFTYSDGFRLSVKIGPSSLSNSVEWMEIAILKEGEFQWLPYDVAQVHVKMLPTLLRAMERGKVGEEIILNMARKA